MLTVSSYAQNSPPVTLNIGDQAPPLQIGKWLKGVPIKNLEKGRVYVVEFWATWCKPCKAAMPTLSTLARKYRDNLTVLGINVYEKKIRIENKRIQEFVDSMSERMDYLIAADKDKFMETSWLEASGYNGIPKTIIVNKDGIIAWIGHPKDIEKVIPKILDNTWDIKEASSKRILNQYLTVLDDSINIELNRFRETYEYSSDGSLLIETKKQENPDSTLFYINKIIKQEPRLQFQPFIAYNTFYSLLKINPDKAYEYGKNALITSIDSDPPSQNIIGALDRCSYQILLPAKIYELGAEAYQEEISQYPYPEFINIPKFYHKMAWWYWLAKNKPKAIEAEQMAISSFKNHENGMPSELSVYKTQYELYKTCSVDE